MSTDGIRTGTAGYSGTPLATKLGIEAGMRVALIGAPADFHERLEPLPDGVALTTRVAAGTPVTLLFSQARDELVRRLPALARAAHPAGSIWVAWPKKAAVARLSLDCDVTEHVIRDVALPLGLVDIKVCAVTDVWSGLKLVWRLEHR